MIDKDYIEGQKSSFARAALVLGICCFFSLLGVEKAILAIVFATMALRYKPDVKLSHAAKQYALGGYILGIILICGVIIIISIFNSEIIELMTIIESIQNG